MLRGLSVKNAVLYESQLEVIELFCFESEGYIHGFTENYVKVKHLGTQRLVNTFA
jgi:threonylcarbamoyladenosine tRNA methylthiotransferase MtaB